MTGNGGISVADALALRNVGGNGGDGFGDFGGNGAWWIIILILFMGIGGWNRNGYGGNDGAGGNGAWNACCVPATQQGVTDAFNFNQLDNGMRGLERGMCDGFYSMNNAINAVATAVQNCCCQTQFNMSQGFNAIQQAINTVGFQIQQGFCGVDKTILESNFHNQAGFNALATQLAQCCCDMRYDMATQACETRTMIQNQTRDLMENQNNNTRQIIDFLVQDKLNALRDENQALKFQASQAAQNAFITANQDAQTAELIRRLGKDVPVPAYVVPNPNYAYNFPIFTNNGGCNACC